MLHAVSLALGLFATWLLWSGHTEIFFVGLGFLSAAIVIYVALRMAVVDEEGVPVHLGRHIFGYWGWLLKEIVKANFQVARIVLGRRLAISPTLIHVDALQKTDLGRVIFANSIILTPATLTMDIHEGVLTVHALTRASAREIEEGEMNRRVALLENGSRSAGTE